MMIKIAKHKMPLCLLVAYFERNNMPQLIEQNESRKNRIFLIIASVIIVTVYALRTRL